MYCIWISNSPMWNSPMYTLPFKYHDTFWWASYHFTFCWTFFWLLEFWRKLDGFWLHGWLLPFYMWHWLFWLFILTSMFIGSRFWFVLVLSFLRQFQFWSLRNIVGQSNPDLQLQMQSHLRHSEIEELVQGTEIHYWIRFYWPIENHYVFNKNCAIEWFIDVVFYFSFLAMIWRLRDICAIVPQ